MAEVFGIEVPDLEPDLGTPIDALVIIKTLKNTDDTEGTSAYRLVIRSSGIPTWEAAGMGLWIQKIAFDEDLYEDEEVEDEDS